MGRNHLGQNMKGEEKHLLLDGNKMSMREKLRSLRRQSFLKYFFPGPSSVPNSSYLLSTKVQWYVLQILVLDMQSIAFLEAPVDKT